MKALFSISGQWAAPRLTAALLLGLVALNVFAIREILVARQETRVLVENELELKADAEAQALLARLANLRSDLAFLAASPALVGSPERLSSDDPLVRRWGRLDVEGALLLFLQGHPDLSCLIYSGGEGRIVTARIGGSPAILPDQGGAPVACERGVAGRWSVAEGGAGIVGWIEPTGLSVADAGGRERLRFSSTRPAVIPDGELRALVTVLDDHWVPPLEGWLVAERAEGGIERSVAALAGRYRRTVLWNLSVILVVSLLVWVLLRQHRERIRAEAHADHERRVRELERKMLHSERLASVGRFAAGIAHEVNNPLEGMGNFLSLLERDLERGRLESAGERAAQVRLGLERAAAVLRRVLDFSDPARSPKEPLDPAEPLREAVAFIEPRFPEVEIVVRHNGERANVEGNRVTLGQLFLNLLRNACEAQGGRGRIEVSVEASGEDARIELRDEGPGIEQPMLARLFEPFVSTKDSAGLGLAICYGIVEDHGGTIEAGNRDDRNGARFVVSLPRAPLRSAVGVARDRVVE